ncbi:hypothetical protein RND81_05G157900 [Saponaria officinalis]|uniref:Trichome birefringence-like N-terminal domain-containing protein n=1 Tax=Saponaria officinalis TaxID=3572 RepID=A0AAW1KSR2_SAPOF
MADVTKYQLITNTNIFSDFKTHFSHFTTRKCSPLIYGLVFVFVIFTVFLAFSSSSSPWFISVFTVNSTFSADESYKSHLSSQNNQTFDVPISQNLNKTHKAANFEQNNSTLNNSTFSDPQKFMHINQSSNLLPQISSPPQNQTVETVLGDQINNTTPQISQIPSNSTENRSGVELKTSDLGALLWKNQGKTIQSNDGVLGVAGKKEGKLVGCDLYDGKWVKDESYPLYKAGSCKLIDQQFNCLLNGRPDLDFQKLKWKPNACSLPRLI